MKRALLLAGIMLALSASVAQAHTTILTGSQARAMIKDGEPTATIHRCKRLGPRHLRCRVTLYGELIQEKETEAGEKTTVKSAVPFPIRVDVRMHGVRWAQLELL